MALDVVPLSEMTAPIAVAAELTQYATFLKFCMTRVYEEGKSEGGAPPKDLLPWAQEWRTTLTKIHDITGRAGERDSPSTQTVQVYIDTYNAVREDLPEAARIDLARAISKRKELKEA